MYTIVGTCWRNAWWQVMPAGWLERVICLEWFLNGREAQEAQVKVLLLSSPLQRNLSRRNWPCGVWLKRPWWKEAGALTWQRQPLHNFWCCCCLVKLIQSNALPGAMTSTRCLHVISSVIGWSPWSQNDAESMLWKMSQHLDLTLIDSIGWLLTS